MEKPPKEINKDKKEREQTSNFRDIFNDQTTPDDVEKLSEKPFHLTKDDLPLIVEAGTKQREKSGNDYDYSIEANVCLSYIIGQLKSERIPEKDIDVLLESFKEFNQRAFGKINEW